MQSKNNTWSAVSFKKYVILISSIWSCDTDQKITSFDRCQLTITWMSNNKNAHCKLRLHVYINLLAGVLATMLVGGPSGLQSSAKKHLLY